MKHKPEQLIEIAEHHLNLINAVDFHDLDLPFNLQQFEKIDWCITHDENLKWHSTFINTLTVNFLMDNFITATYIVHISNSLVFLDEFFITYKQ